MRKIRTYSELKRLKTFEERFAYLKLYGVVASETFGRDRYLNQALYHSAEWRRVRDIVIARDDGCDLGVPGYDIFDRIYIHHMNPISYDEIVENDDSIWDPEFLICTSFDTHNAIHYGESNLLTKSPIIRTPGDTKLW